MALPCQVPGIRCIKCSPLKVTIAGLFASPADQLSSTQLKSSRDNLFLHQTHIFHSHVTNMHFLLQFLDDNIGAALLDNYTVF